MEDMSLMQMMKMCAVVYLFFYILTAICFTVAYPDTVQKYLHSQGIQWKIPGATREQSGSRVSIFTRAVGARCLPSFSA